MKKRILSILLMCCMVLTLLPTTAFAADESPAVTNVTVTFDSNGGGEVESQTIQQGQPAQRPADPIKDGYADRKSTRLNSSHSSQPRMPSSA